MSICHYMQDGVVKGTEMHNAQGGGSWGARDHPFTLCKPPLSHQENTALSALC